MLTEEQKKTATWVWNNSQSIKHNMPSRYRDLLVEGMLCTIHCDYTLAGASLATKMADWAEDNLPEKKQPEGKIVHFNRSEVSGMLKKQIKLMHPNKEVSVHITITNDGVGAIAVVK